MKEKLVVGKDEKFEDNREDNKKIIQNKSRVEEVNVEALKEDGGEQKEFRRDNERQERGGDPSAGP